jgi:hypothetical protein
MFLNFGTSVLTGEERELERESNVSSFKFKLAD